jgi:hypothetical protein
MQVLPNTALVRKDEAMVSVRAACADHRSG